jgi:integrase
MKGSIQKKGNIYYAVIAIGHKRKWLRGGPSKKDAEKVLAAKLTEIDQGTYKDIPKVKFKQFGKLWLRTYALVHVKPSTYASYEDIVNRLLVPAWGYRPISTLTTGHLQLYVSDRLNVVSPKTVSNEIVVIKEMFKHAHRWGYIKTNPSEFLDRPKVVRPEIEILAPEEVERLLAKMTAPYRLALLVDVMTGLRAGELWGLRWSDIDTVALQINVRQSLWRRRFQTPKSKYSIRKVDIPERLASALEKWKTVCPRNEHDLVFPNTEGKITSHDNVVKRHFLPALRRAGLRHVSFHSLRHTNASMRIAAGQNIKYIQTQLGHSSINVTLDIYGHLFNDANFSRQQVKLLEASLPLAKAPMESAGLPSSGQRYPSMKTTIPDLLGAAPDG